MTTDRERELVDSIEELLGAAKGVTDNIGGWYKLHQAISRAEKVMLNRLAQPVAAVGDAWRPIDMVKDHKGMFIWGRPKGDGEWGVGLGYKTVSGGWADAYGASTEGVTIWHPMPETPNQIRIRAAARRAAQPDEALERQLIAFCQQQDDELPGDMVKPTVDEVFKAWRAFLAAEAERDKRLIEFVVEQSGQENMMPRAENLRAAFLAVEAERGK